MTDRIFDMLSPSGTEDKIRMYITDCISSGFDSVKTDNMGNLILHKSGNGSKICIECGMDSRGVMVVSSKERKAYFSAVGQLKPDFLEGKKIIMEDGSLGIVRLDGTLSDSTKISDLYLELEAEAEIGDFGVIYPDFTETDTNYYANNISDIIGAAAVIEALTGCETSCDLTVVFSVQKNLNGRGLRSFFAAHSFDKVISVTSCKCDNCALILKDKSAVSSPALEDELIILANENSIDIKPLVSDDNHLLGFIAHGNEGSPCIGLGIPVSHQGKTLEGIKKSDFENAVRLIESFVRCS